MPIDWGSYVRDNQTFDLTANSMENLMNPFFGSPRQQRPSQRSMASTYINSIERRGRRSMNSRPLPGDNSGRGCQVWR